MDRQVKTYDQLSFTDDFMFSKLMQNETICKRVVELCIGRKVGNLKLHETQKTIDLVFESKGVRLDVYFEDEEGTMYNVEMQTANLGNVNRRSRYYQSVMDLNSLSRGCDYDELPNSYIIFICIGDPFRMSKTRYEFQRRETTDPSLSLQDGSTIIFINPFGNFVDFPLLDENGQEDPDARSFLACLRCARSLRRAQPSQRHRPHHGREQYLLGVNRQCRRPAFPLKARIHI